MVHKRKNDMLLFFEYLERSKYCFLLVALVSLILIYPFFEGNKLGGFALKIFSMLILLSSILVIGNNKRNLVTGVILGAIWIVSTWNHFIFEVPEHLPSL